MKHALNWFISLLLALSMAVSLVCSSAWGAALEAAAPDDSPDTAAISEQLLNESGKEDAAQLESDANVSIPPAGSSLSPQEGSQAPADDDTALSKEASDLGPSHAEGEDGGISSALEEEEGASSAEEAEEAEDAEQSPSSEEAAEEDSPASADEEEVFTDSVGVVNPLYADQVSEDALEQERKAFDAEEEELTTQAASGSVKVRTKVSQAGSDLRKQLKERKKVSIVKLRTKNSNIYSLANQIWEEALRHTGKPTEGDYLCWQWNAMLWKGSYKYSKGKYTYTLRYTVKFFTSASQEKQTDQTVAAILRSLNLSRDSRFVKLHKIYNYVCSNIRYDYSGANDRNNLICHSAYAAAVKKKAVCQGYATLLYRLLLQSGVDSRVIIGQSYNASASRWEGHAWNIVKLNGQYYNLDSTWDASRRSAGVYYQYFLRSDQNFQNHVRETAFRTSAFNKSYPMSSTDGDFHYWENIFRVDAQPTCTQEGSKSIHCADCGKTKSTVVLPALGHDWQAYYGAEDTYYCKRCGVWLQKGILYASSGDGQVSVWASSVRLRYSSKKQTLQLKVKTNGSSLSYHSDTKAVRVDSKGRVTIAPRFTGRAVITVTAEGKGEQKSIKSKAIVTVQPTKTVLKSVKAARKGTLTVKWKKNTTGKGYEIQYAADRRFKKDCKRTTVGASSSTSANIRGLKKKKDYYVRIRTLSGKAKSCWSKVKRVKTTG